MKILPMVIQRLGRYKKMELLLRRQLHFSSVPGMGNN